MIGAIIGDLVGSRWEFNPTNDYKFEWLSAENDFTDDTICTVAVADAILNHRDYGESIHEWCRKYPHPKGGYGGRFAQWVRSDHPQPYGSYGNGSAMRVSPIGMWFDHIDDVMAEAKKSAECSHNHEEGIKGAQTVAATIHQALVLRGEMMPAPKRMKKLMAYAKKISGYDIDIKKKAVINRFDETCQGTVPVALWIISQSEGFEDAIRRAISLGADADTLGAIVGGMAEVIWGVPEKLKQDAMAYLPDEMKQVMNQFYQSVDKKRIEAFASKYITFFEHDFSVNSRSYIDFLGNGDFPNDCRFLDFEMDCGESFVNAYGESAWYGYDVLKERIDRIDNVKVIGSALFSKWRFFNHWSCGPAEESDIQWFLALFYKLKSLMDK